MPRRPTHRVGRPGAKSSVSETRAKSAFSSGGLEATKAAIPSPPTSSSPSKMMRTLTGSLPLAAMSDSRALICAQIWAQIQALESLLAANGKLPVNVRIIFEGDEEVGGEGIAAFVASKPPELKADFALVSDTELFAPALPPLCVGLRGMIYTELEVRGAKTDLHSGMYGGAAPNPFVTIAQMIAKLKDENGHILIPGFYDGIIPPSPEELKAWSSLPFDEEHYRIP